MTVHAPLIGRFGNQMFQYAHARALAEREGAALSTPPWIGEAIFEIPEANRFVLKQLIDPNDVSVKGYCQDQESLIYTRKQAKEWFRFKPAILDKLRDVPCQPIVAHRRVGDYADLGYVVVSEKSYRDAWHKFEFEPTPLAFVSEEHPYCVEGLPDFLPDFYRMTQAKVLFRANSTFSWWAATLSDARVYSPVIENLEGGKEQECEFVEGNWPKFANLSFLTDLYLKDE